MLPQRVVDEVEECTEEVLHRSANIFKAKFRNLSLMISRELEFDMSLPFASTSRKDTDFLRVSEETGFFSNEISLAFARLPVEWLPKTSPVDWFGAKD